MRFSNSGSAKAKPTRATTRREKRRVFMLIADHCGKIETKAMVNGNKRILGPLI